jgi:hypothetical protein
MPQPKDNPESTCRRLSRSCWGEGRAHGRKSPTLGDSRSTPSLSSGDEDSSCLVTYCTLLGPPINSNSSACTIPLSRLPSQIRPTTFRRSASTQYKVYGRMALPAVFATVRAHHETNTSIRRYFSADSLDSAHPLWSPAPPVSIPNAGFRPSVSGFGNSSLDTDD